MAAPALLQVKGNKTFAPFAGLSSELALIQTWQAVSKAAPFLEQGKRLENLSWRLWSLQALSEDSDDISVLNRGRIAGHLLNREKGAPALLPQSGRAKSKCCKIDPSVPCIHKRPRHSAARSTLAAGPSVPLRASSHNTSESGSNNHATLETPVASSSRLTLDTQAASGPSSSSHQKPTQPLWPISSISPHAHLAPSPYVPPGQHSMQGVMPGMAGGHSATQMMLSALIDSLLSAGVAPSVAAQALHQNPSSLMMSLQDQSFGQFALPQQQQLPPSHPGTVPSTPMDWSASGSSAMPQHLDEATRASLMEMFGGQQAGTSAVGLNAAFAPPDSMQAQLQAQGQAQGIVSTSLHATTQQQQQQQQSDWFDLAAAMTGPTGFAPNSLDAAMAGAALPVMAGTTATPTADAVSDQPRHPSLPESRRVSELRHQMQLSSPLSSPRSGVPSPQSDQAGPFSAEAASVSAEGQPVSAVKLGKKKASALGADGSTPAAAGSAASGKGKGRATASSFVPQEGLASKGKDSSASGASKRGPMQTTSSSARKAASTVASPAAPPDQAPPQCSNCGVKKTPLWRRCGEQHELLCNACGLYWAMHKTHRPDKLKHPKHKNSGHGGADDDGTGGYGGGDSEDDGPETLCSNCGTSTTPLWRKDREGNTVCNACGLFMKLHGSARPVKMRADIIKKRIRYDNPSSPTGSGSGSVSGLFSEATGEPGPGSSPAAAGSGSGSVPGSSGLGLMQTSPGTGGSSTGDGTAMDVDVTVFAGLRPATSSGTADALGNTVPASASAMLPFPSSSRQQQQGSQDAAGGTFAPFHPGSDTLGRLTTAVSATPAGSPLSSAQTPSSFSQQRRGSSGLTSVQRQRQEQEQWAQAAGFLLPHEPMGDGFNFGQALWGCDPGVIGNWHTNHTGTASAAAVGGTGAGSGSVATSSGAQTDAGQPLNGPMSNSPAAAGSTSGANGNQGSASLLLSHQHLFDLSNDTGFAQLQAAIDSSTNDHEQACATRRSEQGATPSGEAASAPKGEGAGTPASSSAVGTPRFVPNSHSTSALLRTPSSLGGGIAGGPSGSVGSPQA